MVITRSKAMTSSYDCYPTPCPSSYSFIAITSYISDMLPGNTFGFGATAYYEDCNGNTTAYDATYLATWSSDNPSVATVSSGGSSSGDVLACAGGSANITVTMQDAQYPNCWQSDCNGQAVTYSNSVLVTVHVPTSLELLSTTSQGPASCRTGYGGMAALRNLAGPRPGRETDQSDHECIRLNYDWQP